MRGIGVSAAALVLAFGIGFAMRGGDAESARAHTCSATDKRFIQTATKNMTALGIWAEGYRKGEIDAEEVARHASDAAKRVGYVTPRDPALKLSQRYMNGMFREYGQALTARERRLAGLHMHRAYGLANFAREVLVEAQPELARHGCDVTPLL